MIKRIQKPIYALLLLLGILSSYVMPGRLSAQESQPVLKKTISLDIEAKSLQQALDLFAARAGISVIYSNANGKLKSIVTLHEANQPVTKVLDDLLSPIGLSYELIDGKVVISNATHSPQRNDQRTLSPKGPVKGKVTDRSGRPLAGATIRLKNGATLMQTDNFGQFLISTLPDSTTLLVSFINYEPAAALFTGQPQLDIVMESSGKMLNEITVVSTGFQTLPKERATGSFVQIDSAMLNRRVSTDVLSRLEGLVPSLIFNRNTNASAGGTPDINIRGHSTLFANDQPLIVVDNFPYDGDINSINPNDVAGITVLKDAAAASIWGVRSGNGVIVITTKRGRANQPMQVEMNANVTVGEKPNVFYDPNFLGAFDFIDLERSLFTKGYYDSALSSIYQSVSPVVQLLADARSGKITTDAANTQINGLRNNDVRNDISRYFFRNQVIQQYNLNLKGGAAKSDYYTSIGFDRNTASLVGNNNQRITINSSHNFYPLKHLQVSASLYFTKNNNAANNTLADMLLSSNPTRTQLYPYAQLADANGNALAVPHSLSLNYTGSSAAAKYLDWFYRPLDELHNANNTSGVLDNRLNFGLSYQLPAGFSIETKYQYELSKSETQNLYNTKTYFTRNQINLYTQTSSTGALSYPIPIGSILQRSNNSLYSHHLRGQLNYNKTWSRHNMTALIGSEWSSAATNAVTAPIIYGYNENNLTYYPNVDYITSYTLNPSQASTGKIKSGGGLDTRTDRFVSYFANAAYTFDRRYTISGSTRIDKSNLFGVNTNQKAVPLYSAGMLWHVSDESFYHNDWLPELKLRATYGYNGNINKSATAVTTLIQASNSFYTSVPYAAIASPGNPDLRWEKDRMINLGVDFASVNHRVTGSIEAYFKKGTDLYGQETLPPSTGVVAFYGNTASTRGHGFDISITTENIVRGSLRWITNFQYSYVMDKVTSYGYQIVPSLFLSNGGGNGGSITPFVGDPVFGYYTLKTGPLTHDTGDPQGYLNGQLSTNYSAIISSITRSDLVYSGASRPPHFGSIRNNLAFGPLSLAVNVVYKLGYVFRKSYLSYANLYNAWGGHRDYLNRWQQPGDEERTTIPSAATLPLNSSREAFYSYSPSLIDNASHIRLQDISLSYDLSKLMGPQSPFKSLTAYAYVNNVGILWRANHDHLDPDLFSNATNYNLPMPRTYAVGIKSNFK